MRKTDNSGLSWNMLGMADIETLKQRLCCGRDTAKLIAESAGARIQIGGRTLYKVSRIDQWLEAQCGKEASG